MIVPKIFFISRTDIVNISIALPNGKNLMLTTDSSYQTDDPEEINFLSQIKGVGCRDLNGEEFKGWATAQFDRLPSIDKNISSPEEVREFLWHDTEETIAKSSLQANGWMTGHIWKKEDDVELSPEELNEVFPLDEEKPKPKKTAPKKTTTRKTTKKK